MKRRTASKRIGEEIKLKALTSGGLDVNGRVEEGKVKAGVDKGDVGGKIRNR